MFLLKRDVGTYGQPSLKPHDASQNKPMIRMDAAVMWVQACVVWLVRILDVQCMYDKQSRSARRKGHEKANTKSEALYDHEIQSPYLIEIRNGKFGWESGTFALRNMDTRLAGSSLTIVIGPVGSRKSTLCKALIGEILFHGGEFITSTRFVYIGFCEQATFLSNRSVSDNIIGFFPFKAERYAESIEAISLSYNLETFL
ncbi:hypothetical protein K431DRAFT_99824 [Polychaeton citri CBS 116435]|uniref:ABC transporter domain-containing protein n=1 Tax=Polychaeton citri CBS 116435 TaxID=1314669 RepID=A0A9P4QI28_9PEZI|nr:hypothetical protein K431DRAFT_99824 [Polychaeton citri CBS 116435]